MQGFAGAGVLATARRMHAAKANEKQEEERSHRSTYQCALNIKVTAFPIYMGMEKGQNSNPNKTGNPARDHPLRMRRYYSASHLYHLIATVPEVPPLPYGSRPRATIRCDKCVNPATNQCCKCTTPLCSNHFYIYLDPVHVIPHALNRIHCGCTPRRYELEPADCREYYAPPEEECFCVVL